jgi:hypothetical protein
MLKKGQAEGTLTGIKVSRLIKILHLLFLDDVIIMTNAKMSEWIEIHKILNIFCKVRFENQFSKIKFFVYRHSECNYRRAKSVIQYRFKRPIRGFQLLGVLSKISKL